MEDIGEDLLMGGGPRLDGWVDSMFADSPAVSPTNLPTTTTGEPPAAAAAAAETPPAASTAATPPATESNASKMEVDQPSAPVETARAAATNVSIDVPASAALPSSAVEAPASGPAGSPSAILSSPLAHAHIATDSALDGSASDDEPDAPIGDALDDDDDAMSESSESEGEPTPRKRRASGHVYMEESEDDSAYGYDPDEYEAATGRKQKISDEEYIEQQHANESATACGLPYTFMSPLELEFLPEFRSYHALYVEIRNLICLHWQRDLRAYLTFDGFLTRSRLDTAKLRHCARRIFDFLNLHGFINCGLLPIAATPGEKGMRPTEQVTSTNTPAHVPMVRRKNAGETPTATAAEPIKQEMAESKQQAPDASGDVAMKMEEPMSVSIKAELPSPTSTPPPVSGGPKRVLVIGAGASGLAAARQMRSFGHEVIVLEGRDRVGGRAHTIRDKFSAPVDLGASIMTGLYGSPLNVLSKQMTQSEWQVGMSTRDQLGRDTVTHPAKPFFSLMHYIQPGCPLYSTTGAKVEPELDTRVEGLWNKLLETEHVLKRNANIECEEPAEQLLSPEERSKIRVPAGVDIRQMDIEAGLDLARKQLGVKLTREEEQLFDWHAANLEYGCAASLDRLSLVYWDQDDGMAWEGDHALIKPGFGTFVEHLAQDVDIRFNQHVMGIAYPEEAATSAPSSPPSSRVEVRTRHNLTGEEQTFTGDYLLCTASLGVLKTGSLQFTPSLPAWKQSAIDSLGFGNLNKLILEFPHAWWKERNDQDMFGFLYSPEAKGTDDDAAAANGSGRTPNKQRGKFYIFWNLERSTGKPILAALCAGAAAYSSESESEADLTRECMRALRSINAPVSVPDPIVTHRTSWSQDIYARGSYSFLAAGNNGKEYDLLAKPVGKALYFAGEACNRDYPATVPGAYLSGLRAAGLMQSTIFDWRKENPSADVLRELSKQQKSERSKQQTLATALTQQAAHELHQQGGDTDDGTMLQRKIAEILARQKRRRGIRDMVVDRAEADDAGIKSDQKEENIASKLEAAARLLKAGLFTSTPLQSILLLRPPPPSNSRYAHIKSLDGPMDRPFDARKHDTAGLPTVASFDEFEGTMAPSASGKRERRPDADRREKSRKELRHEKKRRAASSSKDKKSAGSSSASKRSKHSTSHKSGSGSAKSSEPEVLIHRMIGKVVLRLASGLSGGAEAQRSLIKQVHRKSGAKVLEDWQSKPRGKLTVAEWMNDKRKKKIEELCQKYLKVYSASNGTEGGGGNGGAAAAAAAPDAAASMADQPK